MIKIILSYFFLVCFSNVTYSQCTLNTTPDTITIACGQSVTMNTFATGSTPLLSTTFDGGSAGAGWTTGGGSGFAQPCGPGVNGTPYYWASTAGGGTPELATVGFDVSCGGFVSFDMVYSTQGGAAPCEGPDLPNEGVTFQYSTDGGVTWTTIQYWDPNGGNDPMLTTWNNYSFAIPPGAMTSNTMFGWVQNNSSGACCDNWGLDNVIVNPGLCSVGTYDWSNIPGTNDTTAQTVSPMSSTQYFVTYIDGSISCSDTVTVIVIPLQANVTNADTSIVCLDCVGLNVELINNNAGSIIDDFDPAEDPAMWSNISNGTPGVGCTSMSGNALYFTGGGSDRSATTVPIDATVCGFANFCLFVGNSGTSGTCENADSGEDIEFQYSINGGASWVTINTYDESLWDANNSWQCFSLPIPPPAQTISTMFRWRQISFGSNLDNWSLDNVSIACSPPPFNYSWTPTSGLDSSNIQTPNACPILTTNYIATITDPISGCSASDSVLINVTCGCLFSNFTQNATQCQSGNTFTVSGDIEYYLNPGSGTLIVEVTNSSGTYSQTFSSPFTDLTSFNYSISGIPADGSAYTVDIYFSDDLACNTQLTGTSPVIPTLTSISGGGIYCPSSTANDIVVDVTGYGPWSIDFTLDGVATTVTDTSATISLGNAPGVYILTNVNDSACTNIAIGTDSIIIHPNPTVTNISGGSNYCFGEAISDILVDVTGTGPWTVNYTLNGVALSSSGTTSPINLGNSPGVYNLVSLFDVNCNQMVSGTQTITIDPSPTVNAGIDTILCEGNSIVLSATGATNYVWDNGVTNGVPFTPTNTATYTVIGTDLNGCSDTSNVTITHEPLPVILLSADTTIICEGSTVRFTNLTAGNLIDCVWDFGDGNTATGCDTVNNTYQFAGLFNVELTTTSINGCVNSTISNNFIYVEDIPIANFLPNPQTLIAFNTNVTFSNNSVSASSYTWDFDDGSPVSTEENPTHTYPESITGSYEVVLFAESAIGCRDSTTRTIRIIEEIIYYIPNTFTPDGDEFNQTFKPIFSAGYDPYDFNLLIFNRWGEIIWESNDASVGWDGTYNGRNVADGQYSWKIVFKTKETDERKMITGHVNLIR